MLPSILIYRDQILPFSETFIPAQTRSCDSYRPVYVGSSILSSSPLNLQKDSYITFDFLNWSGIWKTLYKVIGYANNHWLKQIRAQSPVLIHAHFGLDGVLALPLSKRLKIPLVVTFHGYYATAESAKKLSNRWVHWLHFINQRGQFFRDIYFRQQQRLFQEADAIIAVSEHIRQALIRKGCPPEKIKVQYIGVDLQFFQPSSSVERKPYVLFVGRLTEKKGCEYLIRAMEAVQAAQPEIELVIVGDGPLRQDLESLASSTLSRFQFVGQQSSESVRRWMAQSKLLAVPSVTTQAGETEGLPMVILEAMAMGLPVVASDHAGIPEAIVHGQTGFLVEEKDEPAISRAILTILSSQKKWQKCSQKARQQLELLFDLKRNTQELERFYAHTIAKFYNQISIEKTSSLSKDFDHLMIRE